MTDSEAARIRIELARGHLVLGELDETYACLARAAQADPTVPGIDELLEQLVDACRSEGSLVLDAVVRLQCDRNRARAEGAAAPAARIAAVSETERLRQAHRERLEAWIGRVRTRYAGEDTAHVP